MNDRPNIQRWRSAKGDISKIKMEASLTGKYVRYADYLSLRELIERALEVLRRVPANGHYSINCELAAKILEGKE
jgi:hypothetical protein